MRKEIYPESLDGHVSHIYNLERWCWDMQYYPNTTASSSITNRPPLHKLQSLSPDSWTQHDKQHGRHEHTQLMPSHCSIQGNKKQTGRQSLVQEKSNKKTKSLTQRWGHHQVSVHQIHKRSATGCQVQNWWYLQSQNQLTKPENVSQFCPMTIWSTEQTTQHILQMSTPFQEKLYSPGQKTTGFILRADSSKRCLTTKWTHYFCGLQ